jgi:hypothetical protein
VAGDPGPEQRVVAGEHPGDVLRGLPVVDADLVGPHRDGVTAELDHAHLAGVARAQRRLREQQGDAPAGERRAVVVALGPVEDVDELVG